MYDQILLDLGKGAFFKAFLALMIFGGGLAAQGKLTPMLSRLTPWGRTIAILAGVQAGQAALSLDAGVAWTLAVGRALPPVAILLVAHYFPSPAAPPADAPPVAPAAPSAAAKFSAKVAGGLGIVLLVLGLSGCTKQQGAVVAPVVRDVSGAVCSIVLQAADPALAKFPICTTLVELEAAAQAMFGKGAVGASMSQDQLYHAVVAFRAKTAAAK